MRISLVLQAWIILSSDHFLANIIPNELAAGEGIKISLLASKGVTIVVTTHELNSCRGPGDGGADK